MQERVDKFCNACDSFGLTVSTKKSEVLHQPAPGKPNLEPDIKFNGQRLKAMDEFTYLGSTPSRNVAIENEVQCRLAKVISIS